MDSTDETQCEKILQNKKLLKIVKKRWRFELNEYQRCWNATSFVVRHLTCPSRSFSRVLYRSSLLLRKLICRCSNISLENFDCWFWISFGKIVQKTLVGRWNHPALMWWGYQSRGQRCFYLLVFWRWRVVATGVFKINKFLLRFCF